MGEKGCALGGGGSLWISGRKLSAGAQSQKPIGMKKWVLGFNTHFLGKPLTLTK